MRRILSPLLGLLLVAACNSGGGAAGSAKPAKAKGGTVLAKVGDDVITVEEFEERINAQGPFARPRFQDPAKRREFLDALIRQELLAQEAQRRGFEQEPDIQDVLKKAMVQRLTRLEYDGRVKPEDISKKDVEAYYSAHPEEFHKPSMARCSAVVSMFGPDANSKAGAHKRSEEAAKRAAAAAKVVPEPGKPLPPDVFRDLVTSLSEDTESKSLGGDLKYLSRAELDEKYGPKVGEACEGLVKTNDVSGVVEGKAAWFVLKKTGHREPIDRTLDQVETQIRNRLFRDRRTEAFNAFVDGLRSKSPVKVEEDKLASVKVPGAPAGGAQPGALPPPQNLNPATGEPHYPQEEQAPSTDPHAH